MAICRLQIISIFSFYIKKKEFKQSSIPNINHNENEIWFQLWCISLYDLLESRAFKKNSPCQKIDVVWDIVHLFWYSCSSMCKYQDLVLSFIVPSSTDNIKGSIISEKALYVVLTNIQGINHKYCILKWCMAWNIIMDYKVTKTLFNQSQWTLFTFQFLKKWPLHFGKSRNFLTFSKILISFHFWIGWQNTTICQSSFKPVVFLAILQGFDPFVVLVSVQRS